MFSELSRIDAGLKQILNVVRTNPGSSHVTGHLLPATNLSVSI